MKQPAYIVCGPRNGAIEPVEPKQFHLQLDGTRYSRLPQWMMHSDNPVFAPSNMSIGDVMKLLLENNAEV